MLKYKKFKCLNKVKKKNIILRDKKYNDKNNTYSVIKLKMRKSVKKSNQVCANITVKHGSCPFFAF